MKICIYILIIIVHIVFLSSNIFAQGSISYDDMRGKFHNNKIMFEALEQILDFSQNVRADIRIMSSRSEKFAGMRLGPYYVCAKQKYGEHLPVRVIFTTKYIFIDKNGKERDESFDFNDKNTSEIKEDLVGFLIEKADSNEYFPFQCQ